MHRPVVGPRGRVKGSIFRQHNALACKQPSITFTPLIYGNEQIAEFEIVFTAFFVDASLFEHAPLIVFVWSFESCDGGEVRMSPDPKQEGRSLGAALDIRRLDFLALRGDSREREELLMRTLTRSHHTDIAFRRQIPSLWKNILFLIFASFRTFSQLSTST